MNQASSTTWDHALLWRRFHSRNVTPAGANRGHFVPPRSMPCSMRWRRTLPAPPLEPALARIHEILADEAPWLHVVHDREARAFSRRVHGCVPARSWFTDLTAIRLEWEAA